jgi:hypothetical protein
MLSQIDKQIVRSWRQYLIEPQLAKLTGRKLRNTGPRIAVVGNCQSFGVAYSMKLMDPSATVDHFSAIGRSKAAFSLFAKTLSTYDYVFSHEFLHGHVKGGDSGELLRRVSQARLFPAVSFAAFHPDLIYLMDATRGHAQLFGPLGPYHSAIATFAFRKGLSLEEANALYNHNVFEALGYFDVWNDAARELIDSTKNRFNMDLSGELMSWARRGVFMYSIVHPKPFVLFDISKRLFEETGLKGAELDFSYYAVDDLARSEVFPVYPAVGELFGVRGSYLFKLSNFHLSSGVGDFLTLPQYLSACYKVYQRAESAQMAHARVDAWLENEATSTLLVKLARENLKAGRLPVR